MKIKAQQCLLSREETSRRKLKAGRNTAWHLNRPANREMWQYVSAMKSENVAAAKAQQPILCNRHQKTESEENRRERS